MSPTLKTAPKYNVSPELIGTAATPSICASSASSVSSLRAMKSTSILPLPTLCIRFNSRSTRSRCCLIMCGTSLKLLLKKNWILVFCGASRTMLTVCSFKVNSRCALASIPISILETNAVTAATVATTTMNMARLPRTALALPPVGWRRTAN